jgi:hypothetical protein
VCLRFGLVQTVVERQDRRRERQKRQKKMDGTAELAVQSGNQLMLCGHIHCQKEEEVRVNIYVPRQPVFNIGRGNAINISTTLIKRWEMFYLPGIPLKTMLVPFVYIETMQASSAATQAHI